MGMIFYSPIKMKERPTFYRQIFHFSNLPKSFHWLIPKNKYYQLYSLYNIVPGIDLKTNEMLWFKFQIYNRKKLQKIRNGIDRNIHTSLLHLRIYNATKKIHKNIDLRT